MQQRRPEPQQRAPGDFVEVEYTVVEERDMPDDKSKGSRD
jgi:hypothetical protein